MKTYELGVVIEAYKTILIEAESDDEACDRLQEICETNTISINPTDEPNVLIDYVEELSDKPIISLSKEQ